MTKKVKCALIQISCPPIEKHLQSCTLGKIKEEMVCKHEFMIQQAGEKKVNILCLQELFFGPYFCAEENPRWFDFAEEIPGPTTNLLKEYALRYNMVIVAPIFEKESSGTFYNTAVVINADGNILGKMRKVHIPYIGPGFWEKFYFKPGTTEFPVFETKYAKIGIYICYDRHFHECPRCLTLNGAEILFNPCAASANKSKQLWKFEQPAQAVANLVFIGASNRVGVEETWNIGEFYGSSCFINPLGEVIAQASDNKDELLIADLDLDQITEARKEWQFLKDRRPEMYNAIIK